MNTSTTKDTRSIQPVERATLIGNLDLSTVEVRGNFIIRIYDDEIEREIRLNIKEALGLREWLDKVIA